MKKNGERSTFAAYLQIGLCILLALAIAVFALHLRANVVHLRTAEVEIDDLPREFDGTRLLYLSDPDLSGGHDERWAKELFTQLASLDADLLIVGGDVTAATPLERLNGGRAREQAQRQLEFFTLLKEFEAPMGKYYLAGDEGDKNALVLSMAGSDVTELSREPVTLEKDGARLTLAGIGAGQNVAKLSQDIHSAQCVITVLESADQIPAVRIAEAKDSGAWSDLILTNNGHDGLVRIGSRTLAEQTQREKETKAGWSVDGAQPLLASSGVGSDGWDVRLGTQSEVWLIILKGKDGA